MRSLDALLLGCVGLQAKAFTDLTSCIGPDGLETRAELPELLNCLGLHGEAAEVGVQAGVHADSFLRKWQGRRLRLVDLWSSVDSSPHEESLFYVDISNANFTGLSHWDSCLARMDPHLKSGRAVTLKMDSVSAAELIADGELDFVYLDARHDFAGVVADVQAWWPKVRVGGIFAGHDFVDGEFPEGDFFWISALREVLPEVSAAVKVTREKGRYPSFYLQKVQDFAEKAARKIDTKVLARKIYTDRSRYFQIWEEHKQQGGTKEFVDACFSFCSADCDIRVQSFVPSRTAGSTLRPFGCKSDEGESKVGSVDTLCAAEMDVDVKSYYNVCLDRCAVSCKQRASLFVALGEAISALKSTSTL